MVIWIKGEVDHNVTPDEERGLGAMKICFVAHLTDFPEGSAPARRISLLAKGLQREDHSVFMVIPQRHRPGETTMNWDGISVHWARPYGGTDQEWRSPFARLEAKFLALRLIIDIIHKDRFDWLILYSVGLEGLGMAVSARALGCRVATVYGDVRYHPANPTIEDHLRLAWTETGDYLIPKVADLNIVDTTFLERLVLRRAPGRATLIIPPLVDRELFRYDPLAAEELRRRLGLGNSFAIGYVGSFWSINGLSNLLHAARSLVDQRRDFKLLLVGSAIHGVDNDPVEQLAAELDMSDRCVLPGWMSSDDVVAAISACDIMTVPRIKHVANEAGSPTKLAEYMAVGRPVVAAAVGDIPRYLTHMQDAVLCEPGDIRSLVQALALLMDDARLRFRLSQHAPRVAERVFSWESAGKMLSHKLLSL